MWLGRGGWAADSPEEGETPARPTEPGLPRNSGLRGTVSSSWKPGGKCSTGGETGVGVGGPAAATPSRGHARFQPLSAVSLAHPPTLPS